MRVGEQNCVNVVDPLPDEERHDDALADGFRSLRTGDTLSSG